MRRLTLLIPLAVLACSPPPPVLETRISATARAADAPMLLPLRGVFADIDALLPEDRGDVGRTLEARAADLRRRATALNLLPR